MTTPNLALPELTHSQYNGEVVHNEALGYLDFHGQPVVEGHTTPTTQPSSPTSGQAWIIPVGATGANWSGNAGKIGHYHGSAWNIYTPSEGWRVYSKEDENWYVHDGTAWGLDNGTSMLTHDMVSDANYTLSTSTVPQEWQYEAVKITDTGTNLTTGRDIIVPDDVKIYIFINATAQTLTLKNSGTGIAVATNKAAILMSDGTNVIRLSADS